MKFFLSRLLTPESGVLWIAGFLLFYKLGSGELSSADEAIHAQVSREMLQNGHWLYPTYRGEPYLEKPPLKFWLTALAFKAFGISEFTARLWSALFGLGTVWAIMRMGKVMFNHSTGLLAGLVLGTTYEFLFDHCARSGELDSALLFFSTMTVVQLWIFRTTESHRSFYGAMLFLGLGFLTKGHLIFIPLLIVPFFWRGKLHAFQTSAKSWCLGILCFASVSIPWLVAQILHYGNFYWEYTLKHNLLGYLSGESLHTGKYVWNLSYFIHCILWLDYPWPPFMVLGGILLWVKSSHSSEFQNSTLSRGWLLGWIALQYLVIGLSGGKLPWYHLPLLIPLSILCGVALDRIRKTGLILGDYSWEIPWSFLHFGLLLLLPGFSSLTYHLIRYWWIQDTPQLDGYLYYFFQDPAQRSSLVALLMLPIVFLPMALKSLPHSVRRSLQVGAILALSLALSIFEIQRYSNQESQKILVQSLFSKIDQNHGLTEVHLFDTRIESKSIFSIYPAFYYYLASVPDIKIINHPAITTEWKPLLNHLDPHDPAMVILHRSLKGHTPPPQVVSLKGGRL